MDSYVPWAKVCTSNAVPQLYGSVSDTVYVLKAHAADLTRTHHVVPTAVKFIHVSLREKGPTCGPEVSACGGPARGMGTTGDNGPDAETW